MVDRVGSRFVAIVVTVALLSSLATLSAQDVPSFAPGAKPYVRWWWFAQVIDLDEVRAQLDWAKDQGFGGVELAFIYPPGRDPEAERIDFLGEAWREAVAEAKRHAEALGLGCDFTFGTLWPFGGSFVSDDDRTQVFGDPGFRQRWRLSWEHDTPGNVLNHLDSGALQRYAAHVGAGLAPALGSGRTSALFCDSWEVESRRIWTDGLGERFAERFGYRIEPHMPELYALDAAGPRYDYMKLVSETVIEQFFEPFTALSHELGAVSRVQCSGAPCDLIAAYGAVDVPESEAMLYEPGFARIPASAAAISGRPVVSAETFTCLYGFPGVHLRDERVGDLKLVADALFANGVNLIVWHGMPLNGPDGDDDLFYATVHVGREGALAPHLRGFNGYLEQVSAVMQRGVIYSDVAVYLPLEDAWIAGEYPPELQMKWSWGQYELRYVRPAAELAGHHPLWVSAAVLRDAEVVDGTLRCHEATFGSLYVDVEWLDPDALDTLLRLARDGLPMVLKRAPQEAGHEPSGDFGERLRALQELSNVGSDFAALAPRPPLLTAVDAETLPDFWCRREGAVHWVFVANPVAQGLKLPLERGQAPSEGVVTRRLEVQVAGLREVLELRFEGAASLLLRVEGGRGVEVIDLGYRPPK